MALIFGGRPKSDYFRRKRLDIANLKAIKRKGKVDSVDSDANLTRMKLFEVLGSIMSGKYLKSSDRPQPRALLNRN